YTSPNQCGGISQTSLWTVYDATSITMALDTRKCNFTVAPAYFTSIGGIDRQRYLRGYNNIYGPTTTTFRIYIHSLLGESSAILLNYSQTYAWTIYWFGSKYTNQTNQSATDPTFCKGTGLSSQALWYAYDNYTMTMNVDTTICNLNETRLYFTSLGGTGNHYLMQAYNGIYSTTINSFRVYANSMLGWSVSNMLSYASSLAWNLNWFALAQTYQSYTSTTCTYPCPCGSVSSWPLWQYEDAYTLMMNVNTTMCGFNQMPVYFTSIGGINGHILTYGNRVKDISDDVQKLLLGENERTPSSPSEYKDLSGKYIVHQFMNPLISERKVMKLHIELDRTTTDNEETYEYIKTITTYRYIYRLEITSSSE
ncbi:unnamed protein product, partial [Rotaria magnacalcarata]